MKRAKGGGRELRRKNFSAEMFLKLNFPPMHILEETFIPEIVEELRQSKEFFRRTRRLEKLVGGEEKLGAAVYNMRKREEKMSRFPINLFKT